MHLHVRIFLILASLITSAAYAVMDNPDAASSSHSSNLVDNLAQIQNTEELQTALGAFSPTQQSKILSQSIEKEWNGGTLLADKLHLAGIRLNEDDMHAMAKVAIKKHRNLDYLKQVLVYRAEFYAPLHEEVLSRFLSYAAKVRALAIAEYLIGLGATAKHINMKAFIRVLSSSESAGLADRLVALPYFSYNSVFCLPSEPSGLIGGVIQSPYAAGYSSNYATGLRIVLGQYNPQLLKTLLHHSPSAYFESFAGNRFSALTATRYPNIESIHLLTQRGVNFRATMQYKNWLGIKKEVVTPLIQHLISSYLKSSDYFMEQDIHSSFISFETFLECAQHFLGLDNVKTLPWGTPVDVLINFLYNYRNRIANHPITSENYRNIIEFLRAQIAELKYTDILADSIFNDPSYSLAKQLREVKEADIRHTLIQDMIMLIERSLEQQLHELDSKYRHERRKLQAANHKQNKAIIAQLDALKSLLKEPSLAPKKSEAGTSAVTAVAGNNRTRAKKPTQRAVSPECEVTRQKPLGFAVRSVAQRMSDAAAANSSAASAVTDTVVADPYEAARAAKKEALELLNTEKRKEERRGASRNSRYLAVSDHALLPLENQPVRASSATPVARASSASHSRDVTPSHKRDATPQISPLTLVASSNTLKTYYAVLEQPGNQGALAKFKLLLAQLSKAETFWEAYRDYKTISARSKTGSMFRVVEFRLNNELRAYFKVVENQLILIKNPYHLPTPKNN